MFISKKEYNAILDRLNVLGNENKLLTKENNRLLTELNNAGTDLITAENRYKDLVNQKFNEISECDFSADFKRMRACLIERSMDGDNKRECTAISYQLDNSPKLESWILYCSRETHNILVELFNSQMG